MTLLKLDQITPDRVTRFYEPDHAGVIIIHDPEIIPLVTRAFSAARNRPYCLKNFQHINNGQHVSVCNPENKSDSPTRELLDIHQTIKNYFSVFSCNGRIECGFTKYPKSKNGSAFHQDFSKNINLTITFFDSACMFHVADNKSGMNAREFPIRCGNILIMRGPRNSSTQEKNLRPIHAVGLVPNEMITFEVREVYETE